MGASFQGAAELCAPAARHQQIGTEVPSHALPTDRLVVDPVEEAVRDLAGEKAAPTALGPRNNWGPR